MKLTFFGAARKVTGSMFLLELAEDYRVLIDCGTDMDETQKQTENQFGLFPFDASLINLVILTHAHIDHSGQIPNLYREGFEGQVLCTEPTADLTNILLYDAASLNHRKLKSISKSKKFSKKYKSIYSEPYYTTKDVDVAVDNIVPLKFGKRFKFSETAWVTFIPAGHLLGAAHVLIEVEEDGELKKICFSGDIGRKDYPLLPDPAPVPEVDYLICESTYGQRLHEDRNEPAAILREIVRNTCEEKPGRLIIPSFSVGRTQALLFTLNKLYGEAGVKPIKVFTDSPLAKASTLIHEKYTAYLNEEAREFKKEEGDLFDFENLIYMKTNQESESISFHNEPCIIISSSGMVQGGRIEHHIAENIENAYATILFIGFTTENTLGAKLRSKDIKELVIKGAKREVNAEIISTDVFSGHGDLKDLTTFVLQQKPERLKKLFLVHGEFDSMCNFKSVLEERAFREIEIPARGQSYEL
ncbi:MBL fold metallo-hydrolase [Marinilongibacter aquaticus]|uniref:MBL fold metallo-hydrolase RNA specificity domain-containing protein n=1 Tax=Marinilongibacter aquaticus TaxID=2975157 RepID=UPI0021BD67FD|nr:MBL fold metallo-hydrolase [Marinilongibacter aquaticus]UBM59796.1 MBL fold metallo-hydrolase [Marinilongibacter aquaticus]